VDAGAGDRGEDGDGGGIAAAGAAATEARDDAAEATTGAFMAETGKDGMADGADRVSGLAEMAETVGITVTAPFWRLIAAPAAAEAPPLTGAETLAMGTSWAQASGPKEIWISAKLSSRAVARITGFFFILSL